jgi:hypothetical protein
LLKYLYHLESIDKDQKKVMNLTIDCSNAFDLGEQRLRDFIIIP